MGLWLRLNMMLRHMGLRLSLIHIWLLLGVASEATIKENLLANRLSDPEISKAGIVKEKQLTRKSRELIREFTVKCDSEKPVSYTHLDVYKRQVTGWEPVWICLDTPGRAAGGNEFLNTP